MKCLRLGIQWARGYGNHPSLYAIVDYIPELKHMEFEERNNTIYGELDGYVHFGHRGNEKPIGGGPRGYGGAKWQFKMKDGSTIVSTNMWSSNSKQVNAQGFPACREVSLFRERMPLGCAIAGAVSMAWLQEQFTILRPDIKLVEWDEFGRTEEMYRWLTPTYVGHGVSEVKNDPNYPLHPWDFPTWYNTQELEQWLKARK